MQRVKKPSAVQRRHALCGEPEVQYVEYVEYDEPEVEYVEHVEEEEYYVDYLKL